MIVFFQFKNCFTLGEGVDILYCDCGVGGPSAKFSKIPWCQLFLLFMKAIYSSKNLNNHAKTLLIILGHLVIKLSSYQKLLFTTVLVSFRSVPTIFLTLEHNPFYKSYARVIHSE